MKDLITEARELCERATPGLWQVKLHNEDYGQGYGEITNFVDMGGTLLKIGIADTAEKYTEYSTFSTFIARSRTLISELCDALEKANSKLDYLHEDIGSVRAQLHTATFSTNKGAADMAKFILALLPAPPEKEGE
jgi:hypothetical protein